MSGWRDRLFAMPSLSLAETPTPLMRAERLVKALDRKAPGGPELWFKRDDLLPAGFGGNKVRALDLVVADALRQDADAIVTGAGPLSNHVRASAAVAALAGLSCHAVYWGAPPTRPEGNYRLTQMLGAEVNFTGEADRASVDRGMAAAAEEIVARGGRPYVVPRGGACPLAALAHARAVFETLQQCARRDLAPQTIVMAAGGGATLAGWMLGSVLFDAPWRIVAVAVSRPAADTLARARALVEAAAALIHAPSGVDSVAARVHDGFMGAGYGRPSPQGEEAIVLTARSEGVFLDPVYTGKAMAGFLHLLAHGRIDCGAPVIFLHSGGAPTLFVSGMEERP